MNRRVRSPCRSTFSTKREDRLHRYLKPGALAQLRDSKVSARFQKPRLQIPVSFVQSLASDSAPASAQIHQIDGFPCFSAAMYGPRFPQRKKLVAAKSMFVVTSPVVPDPIIDMFNSDLLVAH
ncbi:uncharacterized protein [Aristolochia californica]|uniref:uncharacterized protein n=1 Tax=Aristolochia californica TaxID=171875 RepID=UPI0035D85196